MALSILIDFGYTPDCGPGSTKPVDTAIISKSTEFLDEAEVQAQQEIIDRLIQCRGTTVPTWRVINALCDKPRLRRDEVREKRLFYLGQLMSLCRENKVKRDRKGPNRGNVRINEGFASYGKSPPAHPK